MRYWILLLLPLVGCVSEMSQKEPCQDTADIAIEDFERLLKQADQDVINKYTIECFLSGNTKQVKTILGYTTKEVYGESGKLLEDVKAVELNFWRQGGLGRYLTFYENGNKSTEWTYYKGTGNVRTLILYNTVGNKLPDYPKCYTEITGRIENCLSRVHGCTAESTFCFF